MDELSFYRNLLLICAGLAPLGLLTRLRRSTPGQSRSRTAWGPEMAAAPAWALMVLPAALTFAGCYLDGSRRGESTAQLFLALGLIACLYFGLVHPKWADTTRPPVPLVMVFPALLLNLGLAYLNGRILFTFGPDYPSSWLRTEYFLTGAIFFLLGLVLHWRASRTMSAASKSAPEARSRLGLVARLFRSTTAGEFLLWTGWALLTWTLAGFTLALWALCRPRLAART